MRFPRREEQILGVETQRGVGQKTAHAARHDVKPAKLLPHGGLSWASMCGAPAVQREGLSSRY